MRIQSTPVTAPAADTEAAAQARLPPHKRTKVRTTANWVFVGFLIAFALEYSGLPNGLPDPQADARYHAAHLLDAAVHHRAGRFRRPVQTSPGQSCC